MSANVYCVQNVTNAGVNWEVTACQDCDWPNEDQREQRGKKPKKDKDFAGESPRGIMAVEDTTEGLERYPDDETD